MADEIEDFTTLAGKVGHAQQLADEAGKRNLEAASLGVPRNGVAPYPMPESMIRALGRDLQRKRAQIRPAVSSALDRLIDAPAPADPIAGSLERAAVGLTSTSYRTARQPLERTYPGQRGVRVERVRSYSGVRCQTLGCSYNAAWRLDGTACCNQHYEDVLERGIR